MSLDIPPTLDTAVSTGVLHRFARCWLIQSTVDTSQQLRFTDHHTILTLADGQDYSPVGGMNPTSISREAELSETSRETRGIIVSSLITEKALKTGVWDGAKVTEYTVDWMYPFRGAIQESAYWLEDISFDQDTWDGTLVGLTQFLSEPVGEFWQPTCRVDLFSQGAGKCNVNPSAFLQVRTINGSFGSDPKLELSMSTGLTNAATTDYYTDGTVTFVDGDNAGIVREIQSVDSTGVEVTLREPVEYDPNGAQVEVLPGCNKQSGAIDVLGHCKNKFSNLVNFQGEPYIPGRDKGIKGVPIP